MTPVKRGICSCYTCCRNTATKESVFLLKGFQFLSAVSVREVLACSLAYVLFGNSSIAPGILGAEMWFFPDGVHW